MAIKYRILKLHPEEHSVTVRYYSDEVSEHYLRTDPRDKSDPPKQCRTDHYYNIRDVEADEEALHTMLSQWAPVEFLETHKRILSPQINTTMEKFEKLKGVERVVDVKPAAKIVETDDDIEELLEKIKTAPVR